MFIQTKKVLFLILTLTLGSAAANANDHLSEAIALLNRSTHAPLIANLQELMRATRQTLDHQLRGIRQTLNPIVSQFPPYELNFINFAIGSKIIELGLDKARDGEEFIALKILTTMPTPEKLQSLRPAPIKRSAFSSRRAAESPHSLGSEPSTPMEYVTGDSSPMSPISTATTPLYTDHETLKEVRYAMQTADAARRKTIAFVSSGRQTANPRMSLDQYLKVPRYSPEYAPRSPTALGETPSPSSYPTALPPAIPTLITTIQALRMDGSDDEDGFGFAGGVAHSPSPTSPVDQDTTFFGCPRRFAKKSCVVQ